ncbi:agmatinase [Thalassomonas haliotis]|uniref:Agmatinase n=1 Tax=Thalassomonas haliotis TaxID=485448 RepID=A0ABY7VCL6_9GAMM|nr:agmatinase [Thalassomonas haliotis]WDE11354.1 agmatinase [Thalassomonas haliotis]
MTKTSTKVGLLGIPYDENSSFTRGPAKAPASIRHVLQSGSLNSGCENGINLKDNPRWLDCGDLEIANSNAFVSDIESGCGDLLKQGKRLLTLGGDHSISYPILRAYAGHYPKLNILHLDAHSDLYDSFKGNRLSNACPFARIMEEQLCQRLVQLGIRTLNQHQLEQAQKFKVEMIEMRHWQSGQLPEFDGPVYLSLDIDALDPAFAPGVSHREPGGFSSREVINLIHKINAPLVGADIVEFNPDKDIDGITAQLSAKLVKEIAGKMLDDI